MGTTCIGNLQLAQKLCEEGPSMSEVTKQAYKNYDMGESASIAYGKIRTEIISGTFKPGEPLNERILTQLTGVSRTPIREALRRLNSEGMVTLEVYRTAYVADVGYREIEEIFSLARLLGNHSSKLAALRISDAALDDLLDLIEQMEILLARDHENLFEAFAEIDRSFHFIIRRAAGNHRLIRLGRSLHSAPILIQAMAGFTRDNFESFVPLHRKIYDSLKMHDPNRAETAMNNFFTTSQEATIFSLKCMDYSAADSIAIDSSTI